MRSIAPSSWAVAFTIVPGRDFEQTEDNPDRRRRRDGTHATDKFSPPLPLILERRTECERASIAFSSLDGVSFAVNEGGRVVVL